MPHRPGRATRTPPISAQASSSSADCRRDSKRRACRIYESAIAKWPGNWQFHWMLAIARKQSGDASRAEASLEQAMSIMQRAGDEAGAARLKGMFQQIRPSR